MLNVSKTKEVLKTNPFFRNFGPAVLGGVVTGGSLLEWSPGATIYEQGSPASSAFVLLEGEVSLRINGAEVEGKKAPDMFGEVAVWDGGERFVEAIASTQVTVLELPSSVMVNLLQEPGFAEKMLRQLVSVRRNSKN